METFYFLLGLLWTIISIIMIVKFFKISSDLRALKKHFIPDVEDNNDTQTYPITTKTDGAFKIKGAEITSTVESESVLFSDGVTGQVKIYPNFVECGILTDDGFEILYNNIHLACWALYIYKLDKTESSNGFYKKRAI